MQVTRAASTNHTRVVEKRSARCDGPEALDLAPKAVSEPQSLQVAFFPGQFMIIVIAITHDGILCSSG